MRFRNIILRVYPFLLFLQYYNDPAALNYTDGVAVHWYESFIVPDLILQTAKTDKKDVYLLMTEACAGTCFTLS